jgi:anti-sigma-K factor RskA
MSLNNDLKAINNCDAILDLIPEYAFGLTNSEETRLVEANLAHCPEATAQLEDYRNLQNEMRGGVPQLDPSPQLGERLMAAVATKSAAPIKPIRPMIPVAWMVATAATLVLLLLSNVYWMNRVDDLQQQINEQIGALFPTEEGDAFTFARASDIRYVRLPASQENTTASALVMWNPESEIGLLYVQDFPQLEEGRIYQLWFTRGEDRVSAGTFEVDEEGKGVLVFHITEAIDEFTWSRITEEPASGSPQPTGTVVVNGEL